MTMSPHAKGIMITGSGVLVLSPDALLVRSIGAGDWTIIWWRGLLVALSFTLILAIQERRAMGAAWRRIGPAGLLAAVLFATSTTFFVHSITNTLVAKTLIIICASPLIAALFSRIFLGESVRRETWIAISAVFVGVAAILVDGLSGGSLRGDLFALGTASAMAGTLVALRRTRADNPLPAMSLGALLAAVGATPFAAPLAVGMVDLALLGLLGLVVLPVSFGLIFYGPKFLPAPGRQS